MSDEFMVVSSEELASGRVLPLEMVQDLRAVATVESSAVSRFTEALKQGTGVLTEERIETLGRQFFDDPNAESVVRTLQNVRPEFKVKLLALVDRWRKSSDERKQFLTDTDFAALQRNLDCLVQDYPGLALMRKAQRLLRDTGNEIDDAIFICDLRPVFDKLQERIEGFVALANLRVRYVRQSGERDVFEIALTEDELSMLVDHGQRALNKLKVLKETVHDLIQ